MFEPSIKIESIRPSPTNPRRTIAQPELEELAASIREHGVLEPIMLRPICAEDGTPFEIVFGERRWRACKLASVDRIPAIIRSLSDREALEIQLVENARRTDIHPLDEADALRALIDRHGLDVASVALKMGKSEAYVRQRLGLCKLVPEARTALLEGRILPSVAVLLARVPHEDLQRRALAELVPREVREDEPAPPPRSVAEASNILRRVTMLRLADAPFDASDAGLVPEAGACSACPKRTGAQTALFADVADDDLCTDPPCHRAKVAAQWGRLRTRAEERGEPVLDEERAKEVFAEDGGLRWDSGYYEPDAELYCGGAYLTVETIVGTDGAPTLALSPAGEIVKLYPKDTVESARRAAESERVKEVVTSGKAATQGPVDPSERAQNFARQKREAKLQRAIREAIIAAIVIGAKASPFGDLQWAALGLMMIGEDEVDAGMRERWLGSEEAPRDALERLTGDDLAAFVVDLAMWNRGVLYDSDPPRELAKAFGVDLAATEKQATKAFVKAEKAAAKAAAKANK